VKGMSSVECGAACLRQCWISCMSECTLRPKHKLLREAEKTIFKIKLNGLMLVMFCGLYL